MISGRIVVMKRNKVWKCSSEVEGGWRDGATLLESLTTTRYLRATMGFPLQDLSELKG